METTVAEFKEQIIHLLDDEVSTSGSGEAGLSGTQYSSNLLLMSIQAALQAIQIRCWKPGIVDLLPDEGDEETQLVFELDDEFIDIEAVYGKRNGTLLPRVDLYAGKTFTDPSGNGWLPYPYGSITFLAALGSLGATLYLSQGWSLPTDDDDTLEPPSYVRTAMLYYAASFCILAKGASAGTLAQFRTKIDSGTPIDNPLAEMANIFLRRFEHAMQLIPMMRKGTN